MKDSDTAGVPGLNCLKGVRILDLSQFEAGPSCTEALAWLGAEVVKVENPKGGDPGRNMGANDGMDSHYFLTFNANKKSLTVDLKSPAGKKLDFIATPETPTNCVFGGADRKMLYVTAGKSLYRVHLTIEGFAVYWPK